MITLTFGSLSTTLRNPDFGNTESYEARRVNRKSRGGDLKIYRHPNWPTTNILTYTWSFLSQTDIAKILYFLDQSLGQEMTLTDYEGRTWTAIILTPSAEISEAGRENRTISLQFQGVLA